MARIILDLCGGSGAWSVPYRDAGYDVRLLTLPDDVRLVHYLGPVHGILAAPPCTVFANSGARWPRTQAQMLEGLSIVDACLRFVVMCRPQWWALENPVGKLRRWLGPPALLFNPCDYGDPYLKKTLLWGQFIPPKQSPVKPIAKSPIHYMPPSPERAARRSVTPAGFAQAFFKANP